MLFTGCSSGPAKETEQPSTLKVMYFDESYFFQQYGDLFTMKHPNIDIQVVSTQAIDNSGKDYKKAFDEFVEKEQPDVILLPNNNFASYASEGKLAELDTLIERDKFNTESFFPGMLEQMKELGGGKLYGMSPYFYQEAIIYNVDLFKKYGVDVPHDGMSWQELLDLARRFPTDGDDKSRVYGYGTEYSLGVSALGQAIGRTEGLTDVNPDTLKVTVDTDSWKKAYQTAIDAMNSKAVYSPKDNGFSGSMEDYYKTQMFLMGRMAITRGDPYILENLKDAKNAVKNYKPFQVGIVAGPVDPTQPDSTRDASPGDIFAIKANSPNTDAAWEFLKFINGDEFAKIKSKSIGSNGLLSRMGYLKEYEGTSLEPYYKLKPILDGTLKSNNKIPNKFHNEFETILDKEIGQVLDKKKSLDDALKAIQQQGQAALDQAVKDKAAGKDTDGSRGTITVS
ncbi:ABC transporter substrate-binding protein [Paenibacillus puldeungensis]|uniref:ABC transporter substrate-binding protein n=2 Tax=Paenibacillus puldeungensis TaxID=696536 RepID=A0ABW3S3L0_9BACL